MIKLYYACYEKRLADHSFFSYLNTMSAAIREKVLLYNRWEDRHASLFGKLLLAKGLQDLGMDTDLKALQYDQQARPYINNIIDFNISHSGYYVTCVFSTTGRVGVDLEEIKDIEVADFKSQFSENEWRQIKSFTDPLKGFYYYWTLKEAVVKADGMGLSVPLWEVVINKDTASIGRQLWYTRHVDFKDDYILHIASCEKIPVPVSIEEVRF